jgi:hypothetical protein
MKLNTWHRLTNEQAINIFCYMQTKLEDMMLRTKEGRSVVKSIH